MTLLKKPAKVLAAALLAALTPSLRAAAPKDTPIYVGAWSVDNEWKFVTPEVLKELGTKRILLGSRSWGQAIAGWVATNAKAIKVERVRMPMEKTATEKIPVEKKLEVVPADAFKEPKLLNYVFGVESDRFMHFDTYLRKDPWKFGSKIDGGLQALYYISDKKNLDESYFPVLDALVKDFPKIKFAIATHDINAVGKVVPTGKEEIAASNWNIRGGDYSEAVVRKYYGKLPIFDLRDIVSTRPDGTISSFVHTNGRTYRTMVREYARPDGDLIHANTEEGAARLGRGFLILLGKMFCPDKFPHDPKEPKPKILK
jgi:hypothetical protein